jgi:hypothetical protein
MNALRTLLADRWRRACCNWLLATRHRTGRWLARRAASIVDWQREARPPEVAASQVHDDRPQFASRGRPRYRDGESKTHEESNTIRAGKAPEYRASDGAK